MNMAVHFSSADQTWETTQNFFDKLNEEFCFLLDSCATRETAKCATYFTPEDDGLRQDWHNYCGPVWMNPPYGRQIGKWIEKAATEAKAGATVVALIPARTDTKYFHEHVWDEETGKPRPWVREIRFVRGRLKFGNAKAGAPFPSMVVVFGGGS